MVSARIADVAVALPASVLDNAALAAEFPEWSVEKIAKKTGINQRHVASDEEFVSTLAAGSLRTLLAQTDLSPDQIDFVIVCSQSADFYMPATAALVQDAVGIPKSAGAMDINLGCSGYIYGLGIAKGLVESGVATRLVLITADTYTKYLNQADKSVRTIFGDGAAATLIDGRGSTESLAHFVYGTDGSGAGKLMVPGGALRDGRAFNPASDPVARGLAESAYDLYMDGPAIFNFTIDVVPRVVHELLDRAACSLESIDLFVFHQANEFMLGHLRTRLGIPEEKFVVEMADTGNTVSSTIPIALSALLTEGRLRPGMRVMLVGFGVGLSWGGTVVTW